MSVIVSLIAEDSEETDQIIKGVTEDMQYRAEGNDVMFRLEQAYEVPEELGGQYFSMWRK